MQGIRLLQGTCLLPCFRPRRLTASAGLCCGQVPMWLALQLKHRQLCDIKLPEWLRDQDLNNLHQAEDASRKRNQLEQVDFHYQETAALLFRHSPDSFSGTCPSPSLFQLQQYGRQSADAIRGGLAQCAALFPGSLFCNTA